MLPEMHGMAILPTAFWPTRTPYFIRARFAGRGCSRRFHSRRFAQSRSLLFCSVFILVQINHESGHVEAKEKTGCAERSPSTDGQPGKERDHRLVLGNFGVHAD